MKFVFPGGSYLWFISMRSMCSVGVVGFGGSRSRSKMVFMFW